jgi:RNA polymerase sigma-70 factor, ECF subfamily
VPAEAPTDLIDRARTNRSAFGAIYDLYVHRVYAFCMSQVRNREMAEDLTAQTFERALRAIGRYEHRGAPLSSWLFRIAANLATDRGRQSGRLVLLGDAPIPEERLDRPGDPTPEERVLQWERAATVRQHMSELPDDQQRALRLRFWEGYSVVEVGERLGRNENATKQLLHRAVTNLRARMNREAVSDA